MDDNLAQVLVIAISSATTILVAYIKLRSNGKHKNESSDETP